MTYLFLPTVLFEELMELLGKIEGLVNDIYVGRCGSWTQSVVVLWQCLEAIGRMGFTI